MRFFRSFILFIELQGVQERAGQQIRARPGDSSGQCYQVNLQTSMEMLDTLKIQIKIHIQIQTRHGFFRTMLSSQFANFNGNVQYSANELGKGSKKN